MKQVLIVFSLIILSCSQDDEAKTDYSGDCDSESTISASRFANTTSTRFTINSLAMEGDCLKINFGASGCSGETWEIELIDSGAVLESNPPQRNVKLILKNNESCQAYLSKEVSFDVSSLRVDGNEVILNLTETGETILYRY